jgi:hypothetical protein
VRRLQLQKSCPVKVQNVGNQKTHNPPVLCAFLAFKTETSLGVVRSMNIPEPRVSIVLSINPQVSHAVNSAPTGSNRR